jgi:hypothetical protein
MVVILCSLSFWRVENTKYGIAIKREKICDFPAPVLREFLYEIIRKLCFPQS